MSYTDWYGSFFLSKFSIVVLLLKAKFRWNFKNTVISTIIVVSSTKANCNRIASTSSLDYIFLASW